MVSVQLISSTRCNPWLLLSGFNRQETPVAWAFAKAPNFCTALSPCPSVALPHALHRQAGFGGGDGSQGQQADQPHQLVLRFRGGISLLGEHGTRHHKDPLGDTSGC